MAALLASSSALAADSGWQISEANGQVSITRDDKALSGRKGVRLQTGDVVKTGKGSRAVLVRGREYLIVSPKAHIKIADPEKSGPVTQIFQYLGNVLFDIEKKSTPHFGVETPYMAAVVKGTTFNVAVSEDSASVQVTEGAVEVITEDELEAALITPGIVGLVEADQLSELVVIVDDPRQADYSNLIVRGTPQFVARVEDAVESSQDSQDAAPAIEPQADSNADGEDVSAPGDLSQAADGSTFAGNAFFSDDAVTDDGLIVSGPSEDTLAALERDFAEEQPGLAISAADETETDDTDETMGTPVQETSGNSDGEEEPEQEEPVEEKPAGEEPVEEEAVEEEPVREEEPVEEHSDDDTSADEDTFEESKDEDGSDDTDNTDGDDAEDVTAGTEDIPGPQDDADDTDTGVEVGLSDEGSDEDDDSATSSLDVGIGNDGDDDDDDQSDDTAGVDVDIDVGVGDDNDDDGNNGHGNDADGDDASNPGRGNGHGRGGDDDDDDDDDDTSGLSLGLSLGLGSGIDIGLGDELEDDDDEEEAGNRGRGNGNGRGRGRGRGGADEGD